MKLQLVVLACAAASAAAVTCDSITDLATFCPASPTEEDGDGESAGNTFGELWPNPGSRACAGSTCVGGVGADGISGTGDDGADYATCCNTCGEGDYANNQWPCLNDCDTCVAPSDPKYGTAEDCQKCFCGSTGMRSRKMKVPLNICHMFNEDSCCIPVFDTEIDEHYQNLLEAGDRCIQELVKPKLYLRDIFCMACSPLQPSYTVNGTLRICASLVDELHPEFFDDCGMVQVAARGELCDGDDSVLPSATWGTGREGAVTFIKDKNGGAYPPFLEGFDDEIIVVEDNVDCYGSPGTQLAVSFAMLVAQFAFLSMAL